MHYERYSNMVAELTVALNKSKSVVRKAKLQSQIDTLIRADKCKWEESQAWEKAVPIDRR